MGVTQARVAWWHALCLAGAALAFWSTAHAHGKSLGPVASALLIGLLVVWGLA